MSCLHMALDRCPWVLIVLRSAHTSLGAMLFKIYKIAIGRPLAGQCACMAARAAPVCHMSVCVAVCSVARTAWAAASVRAASVGGRSPCAWPTHMALVW